MGVRSIFLDFVAGATGNHGAMCKLHTLLISISIAISIPTDAFDFIPFHTFHQNV